MANRTVMIMVGPDGVGKTTLLATMYHELLSMDNLSGFQFAANEDTHHDLQEAYQKLSTIMTQPTFIPTGSLLKGTAGIIERQFEVLFKNKKELDLVFCDMAGGIIRAKEDNRDFEEFKQKLQEALVIINVIDGSALVEGDEVLSTQKNDPSHIYDLLQSQFLDERHFMILFVITKCEAWLKNESYRKKLEAAFETRYKVILKLINQAENVVGVLIPVKTLGCIEFTHINYQESEQEMIFVRKPNLRFKSENIDQPLRYALAFALLQHHQNRGRWNKLIRWLSNQDIAFQRALTEFTEARSHTFKIYGNSSLIEVTK
ncbi:MAG: hypothetical protein DRQ49_04255 [Gammaproteobacteria bacterium]|nr:MAG: hypothetical protein DRQ49_04255 [Gammaproteobacteria bacterium]RKZ43082.1 MAG: hypothetical protein DRQ41_06170 [Gammaproteobacteria bacterium]RKZ75157.1 MAG: hypothetical protein DRQ57_08550 [Gammaproteobacteria bacterium]